MSNLTFHVVNSVKGGSGKSTFSLLLADYLIQNEELAYIIDLDINGSSWNMNFKNYFEKLPSGEKVYINDLMYDLKSGLCKDYIHNLCVFNKTKSKLNTIPMCIIDVDNPFSLGEMEIDLFENVIGKIILNIYENNQNSNKKINFIFDMPPSREKHAERILNHLLLDNSSAIYQKFSDDIYKLNLYMISSVSPAHAESNIKYVEKLLQNRTFSNIVNRLINKDNCFRLIFVINDVNALTEQMGTLYSPDNINKGFNKVLTDSKLKEVISNVESVLVNYLSLEYYKQQIKEYTTTKVKSPYLIINEETINAFKQAVDKLF